jgi:hypothetical protein
MAQLNYAPTKTNLLRLRNDLKFAQQGYELLDQKRNILIIELLALVDQTVDFQSRVETALAKAYKALEETVFDMGKLKVQYQHGYHRSFQEGHGSYSSRNRNRIQRVLAPLQPDGNKFLDRQLPAIL